MKFFQAVKEAAFSAKLFAAAGLSDFFATALKAGDEAALKAHLDQAIATAKGTLSPDEKNALDEAIAENATLAARVSEFEKAAAAHATLVTNHAALTSAITAAGLKVEKPEDFKTALEARIGTKAAELLAATGTAPLSEAPATDATKPAAKAEFVGKDGKPLKGVALSAAMLAAERQATAKPGAN